MCKTRSNGIVGLIDDVDHVNIRRHRVKQDPQAGAYLAKGSEIVFDAKRVLRVDD